MERGIVGGIVYLLLLIPEGDAIFICSYQLEVLSVSFSGLDLTSDSVLIGKEPSEVVNLKVNFVVPNVMLKRETPPGRQL